MIELCFYITDKKSGKEVYRNSGKFTSLEAFYNYMAIRYNYTSRDYDFNLSGRYIKEY